MEIDHSSYFQARLLQKDSLSLESEFEQLRIEVNKHKTFVKLIKDEIDIL